MRRGTDTILIQIRLPKDLVKQLDHLRIDLETTRAALIDRLIRAWLVRQERR